MTLPEGFTHLIAEDLKLEQIWKGVIEAPNPRALDMLLAKHLRTAGYTFSYSEVSAILENFQHGDRDRNGTYLQTILKSAGFKPDPQVSTLQDAAKVLPDIDFLWDPWLPNGFISLIAGKVGEGKSGVSLSLAGRILTGGTWPDGQPCNIKGPVLWADTESSQSLLVQRAKAWGLPLDQILMPSEGPLDDFRLDNRAHWERLVQIAKMKHPSLIVLDSLRGAHRGDENSSELQEILSRLANLARDLNVAVLVVHHLRKASDMERKQGDGLTLDQLRGSSAIAALARVVWGIDRPDRSSDVRRLLFLKSNMSSFPQPLGFEVTKEAVNWYEEAPCRPKVETVKDNAEEFLMVILQQGPKLAADILDEAEHAGVSKRALYLAKKSLRIVSVKQQGPGGQWKWSLPAPQLWEEE